MSSPYRMLTLTSLISEAEFQFVKPMQDADCYEKETGVLECVVNDADAKVQWYCEDKVSDPYSHCHVATKH